MASVFAGDDLARSVVLIRLFNCLLTVGLLAAVAALVPRRTRPIVLVPLTITCVPIGLYFLGSTNPSSWAILSMAALWPALYASFDTTGARRYLLLAAAVGATVIGAGARTDAALFCVFVVGVVCLVRVRQLRQNLDVLGVAALCVAVAGALFLTAGQSDLGGFGSAEALDLPWHVKLFMNLKELPSLVLGSFSYGYMGTTGWLDTPFPAAVGALGIITWAGMVFHWSRHLSRSKALAMGLTGLALLAYPLVLLTRSGLVVGSGFQPRYALPLLVVFTGMAMLRGRDGLPSLGRAQFGFAVVALSVAHLVALHQQLRRYVTGLDVPDVSLDAKQEWWWDVPFSPNTVWLVTSAAFTIAVYLVLRDLRDPVPVDARDEAGTPESRDEASAFLADGRGDDSYRRPSLLFGTAWRSRRTDPSTVRRIHRRERCVQISSSRCRAASASAAVECWVAMLRAAAPPSCSRSSASS